MVWARLDDDWADSPQIVDLTDPAFRAYIRAVCYVSHYSTDGHIGRAVAPRYANPRVTAELVDAGLWELNGAGYYLPRWEEHTFSRADVEKRKAQTAERKRRWAAKRAEGQP